MYTKINSKCGYQAAIRLTKTNANTLIRGKNNI